MNGTAMTSERMLGSSVVPDSPSTVIRSSNAPAPKNATEQPQRHVAVVAALQRDGEFRIGEGEIDDGAEPVAFDLLGDEVAKISATVTTAIAIQNVLRLMRPSKLLRR